jgi:hypothetical protein
LYHSSDMTSPSRIEKTSIISPMFRVQLHKEMMRSLVISTSITSFEAFPSSYQDLIFPPSTILNDLLNPYISRHVQPFSNRILSTNNTTSNNTIKLQSNTPKKKSFINTLSKYNSTTSNQYAYQTQQHGRDQNHQANTHDPSPRPPREHSHN